MTVSAQCAADLMHDFPQLWEDAGAGPTVAEEPVPAEPVDPPNIIRIEPTVRGRRRQ